MATTLYELLPREGSLSGDHLLGRFLGYAAGRRLKLYPVQEEAVLESFDGKNVILNTPTGLGKSLVAMAMHFASLARGRRSVYTCPIKALPHPPCAPPPIGWERGTGEGAESSGRRACDNYESFQPSRWRGH